MFFHLYPQPKLIFTVVHGLGLIINLSFGVNFCPSKQTFVRISYLLEDLPAGIRISNSAKAHVLGDSSRGSGGTGALLQTLTLNP